MKVIIYEELETFAEKLRKADAFVCEKCGKCCYYSKVELNGFNTEIKDSNFVWNGFGKEV